MVKWFCQNQRVMLFVLKPCDFQNVTAVKKTWFAVPIICHRVAVKASNKTWFSHTSIVKLCYDFVDLWNPYNLFIYCLLLLFWTTVSLATGLTGYQTSESLVSKGHWTGGCYLFCRWVHRYYHNEYVFTNILCILDKSSNRHKSAIFKYTLYERFRNCNKCYNG